MKLQPRDVANISAPDMAVMLDIGWVQQWPFEMGRGVARYINRAGWEKAMARAYEAAQTLGKGTVTT